MTTIVFEGTKFNYSFSGSVSSIETVTLTLTYNQDLTDLSYARYLPIGSGGHAHYFEQAPVSAVFSDGFAETTELFNAYEVSSSNRTGTFISFGGSVLGFQYFFLLEGEFLFQDTYFWAGVWLNQLNAVNAPGGDLAAGQNLLAAGIANSPTVTVTEDDVIVGTGDTPWGYGNSGRDQYSDDGGISLLDYSLMDDGIYVNVAKGFVDKGTNGRDLITSIEDFVGTIYKDVLVAGNGPAYFYADAGNDIIRTKGGTLFAEGGSGDDRIYGGVGDDVLTGDAGDDQIRGGSGDDTIYGEDYFDSPGGERSDDALLGGGDNDTLYGGGGADRLYGNRGDDTLYGDYTPGSMNGVPLLLGDYADRLYGGANHDVLFGGWGRDRLDGGTGDDELHGGADYDFLYGGTGRDVFVFEDTEDMGRDRILDWENGKDKIDLTDFALTFAQVLALTTEGPGELRINFGNAANGDLRQITIADFTLADFDSNDLIL